MNHLRNISGNQIVWAITLLLGLMCAAVLGSFIGGQEFRKVALIVSVCIVIATFLALGKHYWLLIPLSIGAKFPALPLAGRFIEFPELAITCCSVFFVLRVATRKEKLQLFRSVNTPILLFIAWVGIVFALNPIGLAMLGSEAVGARFYIKLALAFAAFAILSNRTYSEKDIKWVLGLLVFGAFFGMIYGIAEYAIVGPQVDPTTGIIEESFYTWHQVLSWPAVTLAFLIFSRWGPKEIFGLQHPIALITYIGCLVLVLLSGKRMGLTAVLLAPVVSAIMYRQFVYFPMAIAAFLVIVVTLVSGQGQWFNLPIVAQRTLSWLPGDWDPQLDSMRGGADDWRAALRRIAITNIQRDPIVGKGFFVDLQEALTAIDMQSRGGDLDVQVASYALGRSWHNIWLGYAADFGIPISVIQAILFLWILMITSKVFRTCEGTSYQRVFALYLFIFTIRDLVTSWTSGHSSVDAFNRWWMYGIMVAIYLQIKVSKGYAARAEPAGTVTDKFHAARPVHNLY